MNVVDLVVLAAVGVLVLCFAVIGALVLQDLRARLPRNRRRRQLLQRIRELVV